MIRFITILLGGIFSFTSAMGQCEGEAPGASAFGGVLTCAVQTVTLQGNSPTPGVVYSWIGSEGFFSSEQNPVVSETGTYFLEVRNPENGCTSVAYVIIVQNLYEPEATATGGIIACSGSAVQLTGDSPTPGVEYAWSGPEGFQSNVQNPVVNMPGNYFLTVVNPLTGCESQEMVFVEAVSAACIYEPVTINDFNLTLREVSVEGNVLTNDYHPEGFPLTVEGFRRATGGGPFLQTVPIQNQGVLTMTNPETGSYVFVPAVGFIGTTDPIEYFVCDTETGQCISGTLSIKVIDDKVTNSTPVAIGDHFQTSLGIPVNGSFLLNDFDADGDLLTVNTVASSGNSSQGGSWSLSPDNTFNYTPLPGFTGLDSIFIYEICDGVSGCDMASLTVWVLESGAENSFKPSAVDDARVTRQDIPVNGNMLDNDLMGLNAEYFSIAFANGEEVGPGGSTISTINGGSVTVFQDGSFSYAPANAFIGSDRLDYQVCNNGGHCDKATAYFLIMPPACIDLELWVYLEGPFQTTEGQMSTYLNLGRSILPGQLPLNSAAIPTPAGNPYRDEPWNYSGTPAEENFDGPYVNGFGEAVTDWVLVSFRSGISAADEITKAAGLLFEDGHIEFIEPCVLRSSDPDEIWIVVEHRNHMGVMSDSAVFVQSGKLIYDFRQSDSYHTSSSFGQSEVAPGVWAMYTADADQTDFPGFDINGTDNIIWVLENGNFDKYRLGDFDLNGDINGADNILYNKNNGVSSSVPKE